MILKSTLDSELNKFTKKQRKIIYNNLFAIELNEGCSVQCDFCGSDPVKGVKDYIPYSTLERIAEEIHKLTNRTKRQANRENKDFNPRDLFLHCDTDGLDYEHEGYNYFDIRKLFRDKDFDIFTSTSIPKGKEKLAIKNLEEIDQISISHMNRRRLKPYFKKLGISVYIDLFNFKVSQNLLSKYEEFPEMYYVRVSKNIEDTVKKLRAKDSTLPKKTEFYNLNIHGNKWRHLIQDGKTLFLFCTDTDYDPKSRRIIDRDFERVINIGRAYDMKLDKNSRNNFNNYRGVKITHEGIYNVISVTPTKNNKTGKIHEKITPYNFNVVKLDPNPDINIYDKTENHYVKK